MHSTAVFTLVGAYATAATMANPLARVGPTPQINANCQGPIVNLFAFTASDCNNTGTSSSGYSPFFYQTKFSAISPDPSAPYESDCKRINVPGYTAASIVYTSDGAYQKNCYLNLYDDDDCSGDTILNKGLKDEVSKCINGDVSYAKVYCSPQ